MGAASRNKGARGEREFFAMVEADLGIPIKRNLNQWRNGGADGDVLLGPFAVEVKRCETLSLPAWWDQAVSQAKAINAKPALAYRQSRRPWRVVVALNAINDEVFPDGEALEDTADLPAEAFFQLVRERMEKVVEVS